MDLDSDGHIDILSGCYSRHSQPMAGLFWILRGNGEGGFQKAAEVKGDDGEPLVIRAGETRDGKANITDSICTRPFAADLDGDGKLDILSGNFSGNFALFRGLGEGKFEAKHSWLQGKKGKLYVGAHSDPFLIDFDGDGDLDLFSGSSQGGVYYFENEGSAKQPSFGKKVEIAKASRRHYSMNGKLVFGADHIQEPQSSTRVWVADANGDGKLDVLIGDNAHLEFPAKGVSEDEAREKFAAWNKKQDQVRKAMNAAMTKQDEKARKKTQKQFQALWQERQSFIESRGTGYVWVMYQK